MRRGGEGTAMGDWLKVCLLVAIVVSMGDVVMAKGGLAAKNAKPAKREIVTGNLSKMRRDELTAKIGAIKSFLEKSSETNATRLLRFAAEVEREVRDKKFGLVFEEHRERVDVELAENLPVLTEVKKRFLATKDTKITKKDESPLNFLIEGDNLAALKLLEKTHRGKIDVIYIDPPYNTGNQDFAYNDEYVDADDGFRHSKWLSFMEKRLRIARNLLTKTGAIFISIDDNEFATLKVLCDTIFDEQNFVNAIVIKMSEVSGVKMSHITKRFPKLKEYCLVYCRDSMNFALRPIVKYKTDDMDKFATYAKYYSKIIVDKNRPVEEWEVISLDEYLQRKGIDIGNNKELILKFKIDNADRMVYRTNNKAFESLHIDKDIARIKSARGLEYIWWEGKQMLFLSDYVKSFEGDLWTDISTINLNKEGFVDFPNGKKPLKLLTRILQTNASSGCTILDFFAGSGTTGHAVMKLNAEDGGKRKFILVTNNENGICEKVTYERLKRVMKKEKYAARLKYLKIDYVPIKDKVYYEYADDLLKHIRELVELENAIDFKTDSAIAITVTDKEFEKFVSNEKMMDGKKALYVGHDVLIGRSARLKLERRGIEIRIIPQYYYSEQEA